MHDLAPEKVWKKRYDEIRQFESLLVEDNTIILKFYLHISKPEQRLRLLAREDDPAKAWKLSANDWKERAYWDRYMDAYADAIGKTAAKDAPWYVVPANDKWYRNYAIAEKIVSVLKKYKPEWDATLAKIGEQRKADLQQMRADAPEPAPDKQSGKKKAKKE